MFRKLLLISLILIFPRASQGQYQYNVLHAFGSGSDGAGVWDSVTFDSQRNLYGTTSGGGTYGYGTVFELSPSGQGNWDETVLHNFCLHCDDGAEPQGSVTFDSAGNLYGTTSSGGSYRCSYGCGTIFELTPALGGWAETVLYDFCGRPNCADGGTPYAGVITDGSGNLYGTAHNAFKFSHGPDGGMETVLHNFLGGGDGLGPQAGPIIDASGNLYGTTLNGGGGSRCTDGCGTVYQLLPTADGVGIWRERILHRFGYASGDGVFPSLGQLAMDRFGNLYGATSIGGTKGYGTVFKLSQIPVTANGMWLESILYNFTSGAGGMEPGGGVTLDNAGNLYGTTIAGGGAGCGVVYELSPIQGGKWQYTLLHSFIASDGCQPDANLVLGPDGNLYGTTATGGTGGAGVVFQIQIAP